MKRLDSNFTAMIALALGACFGCGSDEGAEPASSAGGSDSWVDVQAQDTGGDAGDGVLTPIHVSSDFESGSIGEVTPLGPLTLRLALRDDNDDASLPDSWRSWWYVRLDDVPVGEQISLQVTRRGFPYHSVPVYSYDNQTWHRMGDFDVQSNDANLFVRRTFEASTVWLAAFYPYTATRLDAYLDGIETSEVVEREVIGTTKQGRNIEMLTLTDDAIPEAAKSRIWIHGRTHPAETGSSFLLEGLIDFLLSGDPRAESALEHFVFSIVPMHNVDGVVVGNYRTTPGSVNLEDAWHLDVVDPFELSPYAPQEVHVLRDGMADSMEGSDAPPVTMALNLHSSHSEPEVPAFFFPHFGPSEAGYTPEEAALWEKQLRFIAAVESHYGDAYIEDPPSEGGSSFVSNEYPETWWWTNFGPDVMAITLETVYGRAGFDEWVTPEQIRALGVAVGRAILDYHEELR